MALYFNSNQLASFSASNSAVNEVLTTGTFYAGAAKSSMSIPARTGVTNAISDFVEARVSMDATSVTTLYDSSDRYYTGTLSASLANGVYWQAANTVGQVVAQIAAATAFSNNAQFQYWNGSGFIGAGPVFSFSTSALQTLNVRITCGAAGSVDIWLGAYGAQALVCSVPSSAGLNAAVNNIAAVRHCNPTDALGYVSSVVISDYDLRARRWMYERSTGAGAFNDGTGVFSDTNSFPRDLTKSRVLAASGNKFSMSKAAVSFPGNMVCEGVVINAAMRATGGVVTNARHGLSIAGVWYPMPLVNPVPNGGYENRSGYLSNNPVTGVLFTSADVNAAQFGSEARP
jgi:hypothetical protein